MDWDHLRYFWALVQAGTLVGAAKRLGVEHTTVSRRIQALEKQMGATLFTREGSGYKLTDAGRQLQPQAEAMDAIVRGISSAAPQDPGQPSGVVRIGVTEGFGTQILARHLALLSMRHPQLTIDLLAVPRMFHLSRREADIVISLDRPARDTVVTSRLTDYSLYLYGQREYLARQPLVQAIGDLAGHSFVNYVDDQLFTRELQLLETLCNPQRYSFRSTSVLAQYTAVRAGAGLGVLPAFLADKDPLLQRVLPEQARFTRTFWMSMPPELRSATRVQTVWRFIQAVVQEQAGDLLR
ncbi:MAG: LysR family transcriptional regulator [Comamonas sp.]